MLLEFRVENYRCFADEAVLRLTAASDSSLPGNLRNVEGTANLRAIKSALVYGPNGSGKSTLIRAAETMRNIVRRSATGVEPDDPLPVDPFRLDSGHQQRPSSFEMTFIHQGIRHEYGFSATKERIHEEWLYVFPRGRRQTWFERTAESTSWRFGPSLVGEKERIRRLTRPNSLYLSTAAHTGHPQLSELYAWFSSIQIPSPKAWRHGPRMALARADRMLSERPEMKDRFVRFLRAADVGIEDFEIETKGASPGLESNPFIEAMRQRRVRTLHRSQDSAEWFDLQKDESLGTQELFYIAAPWLTAMESGAPLLVDEALSALHPALVRFLIGMVHASPSGQLIMATHETSLLDPRLMRRDQIYFVEKDASGRSHLYSLLEFKPRKGEAFARGYLSGRYGAIPFLGSFEFE